MLYGLNIMVFYRLLVDGEPIPDDLYMNMVLKFIQNNSKDKDGWALMNFPETLIQANIFETLTTGAILDFF